MKSYLIKKDQNGNKIIQKPINNESVSWESVFPFYNSVTSIGAHGLKSAFYICKGWTGSISFPSLTSIGISGLSWAFRGCTGLTSVSFPSLTSISGDGLYYTFYSCTGLTGSISFPNLTDIGESGLYCAFYGCTGLKEVHFKSSLSSNSQCTASYMGCSGVTIYFDL